MFIIHTIPLRKGGHLDTLTYFSKCAYSIGTLLSVPVRTQTIAAIVTACEPVPAAKTMLRNMTFSLKKLPEQRDARALTAATRQTAEELASYYATPVADVLTALLPTAIRDGDRPLPYTPERAAAEGGGATLDTDIRVLQAPYEERMRIYRTLIREAFARGGSVVVIAPTSAETIALSERLCGGIEDRTIVMHAHLSAKETRHADTQLQDFTTPKLIVTYPGYALIERHDVTVCIIDHERSHHYVARTRPHIDTRIVLRLHAARAGRTLILGDLFPRTETEHERRIEHYATLDETPRRLTLPGTLSIISRKHTSTVAQPFELFSPKVLRAIQKTIDEKGRVFLFAARRGLAPVVTCVDCGYIFRAPESGAPYSLVRTHTKDGEEQRWFVDGVSGARVPAASNCAHCGSWRIRERGIGIQHVHDELSKNITTPIILFDNLTANTPKKARYLSERFRSGSGVIMLGTAMALPYIGHDVSLSVVVNTDALRATPTWRAQEDMLATLLTLRECTRGTVYAQTQHAPVTEAEQESTTADTEPDDILDIARMGATEQFYSEEIVARRQFGYPPFARFILLTYTGTAEQILAYDTTIQERLGAWKPLRYNGIVHETNTVRHALVRIQPETPTTPALVTALRTLPPEIAITIDPERII